MLYLFIFESISVRELIFIGLVFLFVFEPRKLTEIAKKAAKFMREIQSLSNDYRFTWERKVALFELGEELKNRK